ncbi:Uncharacterised protein r2_g3471 [Pycnogonum litorale]
MCRNSKAVDSVQENESAENFLGTVSNKVSNDWRVTVITDGNPVETKVDSGTDVNLIGEETFKKFSRVPKLENDGVKLMIPGGRVECLGWFESNIMYKERTTVTTVYVSKCSDNLLSRDTAVAFGVLSFVASVDSDVFGKRGSWKMDPVKVHLKENAIPWSVNTARRIAIPLLEPVKRELDIMLKNGIISKFSEPTDWCAPIVPVAKKVESGKPTQVRICVDLRRLNLHVKREKFVCLFVCLLHRPTGLMAQLLV